MTTFFAIDTRATLATGLLCASLTACGVLPKTYYAEPIRAQVVDSVTKQPIEGAIVVAQWLEGIPNLEGFGPNVGNIELMEAVTDTAGYFSFPGWGPIQYSGPGVMRIGRDPIIHIYKPGYYRGVLRNEFYVGDGKPVPNAMLPYLGWQPGAGRPSEKATSTPIKYTTRAGIVRAPRGTSIWNGEALELKALDIAEFERVVTKVERLNGDVTELYEFSPLDGEERWVARINCDWKKIPRTVLNGEEFKRWYLMNVSAELRPRIAQMKTAYDFLVGPSSYKTVTWTSTNKDTNSQDVRKVVTESYGYPETLKEHDPTNDLRAGGYRVERKEQIVTRGSPGFPEHNPELTRRCGSPYAFFKELAK